MVSENLFDEPSILSEQKSSASLLEYKNFKIPEQNFVKMAQIDSLGKTLIHQNIDKNEKINNHNSSSNDLNDDYENLSSDIELTLEESDDKEAASENEDITAGKNEKNNLKKNVNAVKDAESSKLLDADLTNTAHLVGAGFSADEFDQIDSLDTIDNSTININSSNVPNSHSTDELSDSEKDCIPNKISEDSTKSSCIEAVDNMTVKDENSDDKENISSIFESEAQVNANSAEIERNHNTTEKMDNDDDDDKKSSDSTSEIRLLISPDSFSETVEEKVDPEIVQKHDSEEIISQQEPVNTIQCEEVLVEETKLENTSPPQHSEDRADEQVIRQSLSSESSLSTIAKTQSDDSNVTREMHVQAEKNADNDCSNEIENSCVLLDENASKKSEEISVHAEKCTSISNAIPIENTDGLDQNDVDIEKTVPIKNTDESDQNGSNVEKSITIKNNTASDQNDMNIVTTVAEIHSENDSLTLTKDVSLDGKASLEIIPNESTDKLDENCTTSVAVKGTENHTSLLETNQHSTEDVQMVDCSGKDDAPQNDDLNNTQINEDNMQVEEPVNQIDSLMAVDDDKEPASVESTEIIIDSVESEIVELDADDEPVILDDDGFDETLSSSVSQTSQQKFNQLFENTAKEIVHDDIGAEEVVGQEDSITTSSNIINNGISGMKISLNRITPAENDSRKRRFQHDADKTSATDSLLVEKRARVNGSETSDSCTEERKKKPPINRARKHTSSTNVDKTFKEIEKKIRGDFDKRNKIQESSSGQDLFERLHYELPDNHRDIISDTRCEESAQSANDNSYNIKLNYDVVSKDNLKNIFKIMRTKLTRRQLEEIVIQKCCEMISDSEEIGTLRRQIADLQQAEAFRKQKILNLEKQISQLKAVCQRYLDQVRENPSKPVTPIKITRSVGLQVAHGDSSPYVNFEPPAPAQRSQEKLKKLLSAPASKKPAPSSEIHQNASRQRTASPSPSSINHRNNDPRMMNGNARISSPLSSCSSPTPSPSPAVVSNSRNNKKITKSKDADAPVIDLTDKDDKNENEGNVAAKNLLATVNGTVVTYVPVKVNQDQNRQVIKPGTSILVNGQLMTVQSTGKYPQMNMHPAPVPLQPSNVMVPGAKPVPPRPILKIDKNRSGIMLSWEFPLNVVYAEISKYQLFAYQETDLPPRTDLWKAVGDVTALPLPMACTLTQFVEGYKYHFIVRAVDVHSRCGPFSVPRTITL